LQTLPRKDGGEFKACFVSRFKDGLIYNGDESQVEVRVMAYCSQDAKMIELFNQREDMHRFVASQFYGKSPKEITKDQRTRIKRVVFGMFYDRGADAIAEAEGMPLDEVEGIIKAFWRLFAEADTWKKRIVHFAKTHGYTYGAQGRIRLLPNINNFNDRQLRGEAERQAGNCVDIETEILTAHGWRRYDQIGVGDLVYTKNPASGLLELNPIEALTVQTHNGPMVEVESKTFSALTTPNHRWLVDRRTKRHGQAVEPTQFVYARELSPHGDDKIHLTALPIAQPGGAWTDDEATLVGWVVTDGHYIRQRSPKTGKEWGKSRVCITQSSRANPDKCRNIDDLFSRLGVTPRRYQRDLRGEVTWTFGGALGAKVRRALPGKRLTASFLQELSSAQLRLLYTSMLLGDGCWDKQAATHRRFCCADRDTADTFSHLCVLLGVAHRVSYRDMRGYTPVSKKLSNSPRSDGGWLVEIKRRTRVQSGWGQRTLPNWSGIVWCPTVENSTWVARRNGIVYITGNSPIQGLASDFAQHGIVRMMRRMRREQFASIPFIFVHDSFGVDCYPGDVGDVVRVAQDEFVTRAQQIFSWFNVPFVFEHEIGLNLRDSIEVEWDDASRTLVSKWQSKDTLVKTIAEIIGRWPNAQEIRLEEGTDSQIRLHASLGARTRVDRGDDWLAWSDDKFKLPALQPFYKAYPVSLVQPQN
jgi:hypothetical protein